MEKYVKVIQFGDRNVARIIDGLVLIESKIDGSLFRIHADGLERTFGSKSIDYSNERPPDKLFNLAIEQATKLLNDIQFDKPTTIYCEYLKKPKHNTICYDSIPKNNLMIFDVVEDGRFLRYDEKVAFAKSYGFDYARKLDLIDGSKIDLDYIKEKLQTISFLGGSKVEGIVFKNYDRTHIMDGLFGKPLIAKYVSEEFKEINHKNWRTENKKGFVENLGEEYKTPARWAKAVQHLKESGELTESVKDIGALMKEVGTDVLLEEKENIKEKLFKFFWKKNISKEIIRGLPEWYKEKLVKDSLTETKSELPAEPTPKDGE